MGIEPATIAAMEQTNDSILTLRLTARDRALLEAIVDHEREELADRGVEVTLAVVVRGMIRAAAAARGIDVDDRAVRASKAKRPKRTPAPDAGVSQTEARRLLVRVLGSGAITGSDVAKRCDVQPAQVSRFKNGKEDFPAHKLRALHALLKSAVR